MSPPKRSLLFWIALALGGSCAVCSVGTVGVVALGALATDDGPAEATTGGGGEWIPSGEIARGTGLTQPLVGGRWLFQNGSSLETVTARFSNSAMVQTSSSGTLHELSFEEDGSYRWQWVHSSNFQMRTRSSTDERGTWALQGNTLTLTPESQRSIYSANTQVQEKEDVDLAPRVYQVVDITLETVEHTGAPLARFPGVELSGPVGPWDLDKGTLSLDLQRL